MSEESQQFAIQKLYLKDASFESPNSPAVFLNNANDWQPNINVQINSSHKKVADDAYEVILSVTITAKQEDKTVFLCEVQYAGVFAISGFTQENLEGMVGAYCPETLFPFVREVVSDLIVKGGFPQFLLAPVNFNTLYAQQLAQKAESAGQAQEEQETAH